MSKYKIAIGFPTGNSQVHECVPISLLQMMSNRNWSDYSFTALPRASMYIVRNRNDICKDFLKTDCDFLYFWDSDNGILPNAFDLFMNGMEDPKVNILSGLYFRKEKAMRAIPGISFEGMEGAYTSETAMFVSGGLIDLTTYAGAIRGMTGGGALMIRREVIEALPYPWFDTKFYQDKPCKGYDEGFWGLQTEDVYFCELAQEHGYHIYLDTRIQSPHYSGNDCYPENWAQWGWEDHRTAEFDILNLSMPEGHESPYATLAKQAEEGD
jgi:GT2 family glycosyltransferase